MKKLKVFLFCAILTSFCCAQEIEWQNTIGGNGAEWNTTAMPTPDGGYILSCFSASNFSGDKTEDACDFSEDFWIIKLNSLGNIQWQNTIGGGSNDELFELRQTMDGGYIMGGWSVSNISYDKTENCILGSRDYWVVKVNSAGTVEWDKTIGGASHDWLTSVFQTNDGGYLVGGYTQSGISFDKTDSCIGSDDFWVLKLDTSGNIEWQKTLGGTYWDAVTCIEETIDGKYVIGGYSASGISGNKTTPSNGDDDFWLVVLDSLGNINQQVTIGGNSSDRLYSMKRTTDLGFILVGRSISNISGDKTENFIGVGDSWVVKLDVNFNIQWQNTIGAVDAISYGYPTIDQAVDGSYIVGATSNAIISGDKTEMGYGIEDFWVIKLDGFGNIQWQRTIGGDGQDHLVSAYQNSEGDYVICGNSNSTMSGVKTENCIGPFCLSDFWVISLKGSKNHITGNLFIDANSNNVRDAGEHTVANKIIVETNTSRITYSQQNGSYELFVLDTGNFAVATFPLNYYNFTPALHSVYFNNIEQIDSLNDFAFQPTGVFNDLCVTITPLGNFREGMDASYMMNYENVGTTSLSGDVIFFPFNNVTYVSSNTTPTAVTTDSVVWSTGLLAPFQTSSIIVTVNVNVGTPIGSLINSSVRIEPIANDANPGCNYHSWEVITTGSLDPNDILVSEDTLATTQLATAPFLDYIIRFQNTGNDTAFTVKVLNPIDTNKLELSTIEFVNASHPVNLSWINYQRNMEFKFNNILLPDSNTNESASHGFVHYRIKPKTNLLAGDSVANNAYIYFDFNSPVATNTAHHAHYSSHRHCAGGSKQEAVGGVS